MQTESLISKHGLEMQEQAKKINKMHCELDSVCGQDTGVKVTTVIVKYEATKRKREFK